MRARVFVLSFALLTGHLAVADASTTASVTPTAPIEVPPLKSAPSVDRVAPEVEPGIPQTASQPKEIPTEDEIPVPVKEEVDRRTENSRVFRNDDGSLTVDAYTEPIFYDDGEKELVPIDNSVESLDGRPGWVGTTGNRWTTGFGPLAQGMEIRGLDGTLSMRPVTSADPAAKAFHLDQRPTVVESGKRTEAETVVEDAKTPAVAETGAVTYDEVWSGVDLTYQVSAVGVKENIVVNSTASPSEYLFDVDGATFSKDPLGGLLLHGALGDEFRVPPPVVLDAQGNDVTTASAARYESREAPEGRDARLAVVVDAGWLAALDPGTLPITVDPAYNLIAPSNAWTVVQGDSFSYFGEPTALGVASGLGVRGAVRFPQYESFIGPSQNYRVYSSFLYFIPDPAIPDPPPVQPTTSINVYDQDTQPTSYATIGDDEPFIGSLTVPAPPSQVLSMWTYEQMDDWVTSKDPGHWFGLRGTEVGTILRAYHVRLNMTLFEAPLPTIVTSPSNGEVIATTTPTLRAAVIPTRADGVDPFIEFQVTTEPAPGSGLVVTTYAQQIGGVAAYRQLDPGSLQEGVTYWAWAITDWQDNKGHVPKVYPSPSAGVKFTVDLGLGSGGPSPTDQIGEGRPDPGLPAQGAPSPSLPGASLTVNLVDGNLATTVGTPTMETVAGPLGLSFTYNSLALGRQGLRGQFYNDTDNSGSITAGDLLVGDRVDPTVFFDWGPNARAVAGQDPTRALAQWTGQLKVPDSGNWRVGAVSSDGLRVTIGGTVRLDQWATHEPQAFPEFGGQFFLTGGVEVPITIDWRNSGGAGVAAIVLYRVDTDQLVALPPAWLSRDARVLPEGWSMNAAVGSARWIALRDRETSVALIASDGSAHEFINAGNGAYTPPNTAPNDLLTLSPNGQFVLRDAAGRVYTFRADGALDSLTTSSDDRNPAALKYGYVATRLTTITDPVSNRSVTLRYGPDSLCGSPAAPAGLLCRIDYWDGTNTLLTYDTSSPPRLIRFTNPGNVVHDFAYDGDGRMTSLRDPLALAAIASGARPDDATTRTAIAYYTTPEEVAGRVFLVVQPRPTSSTSDPRPARSYSYDLAGRTGSVFVAGFTPSTTGGYAERLRYDSRNRIVERTGPDGLSKLYAWDDNDRHVATTDEAGLRTTTQYDFAGRPVTVYGPAPTTSFQANGTPQPGAVVPKTTKSYDENMPGLAGAYWTNPFLAGGPSLHDTGLGTAGDMDRDWASSPPVTPGVGGWSAQYTGYLFVPTNGSYQFQVATKGSRAQVWIDDQLTASYVGAEPTTGFATATGTGVALTPGPHRIRTEMVDPTGPAGLRVLWRSAAAPFAVMLGSALTPNYGLLTSVVDPDGKVTSTEYSSPASGIGPHLGLPTANVVDPGGLNLRTSIGYEPPSGGGYLRRTSRTLPSGSTWTTANYGGTDGPIEAVCGVSSLDPQAGLSKRITGPDPDGAGAGLPRVEEFVYDTRGRQVGHRVGDSSSVASAGWVCTTFDTKGRLASQTFPARPDAPARTVTYTYAVAGNPLVNRVSDTVWGSAAISATTDLLGRPISYSDIWGYTTTTKFDQAGRLVGTVGPLGTFAQNFSAANGRAGTTVINGVTVATPAYDAYGRTSSVVYSNGTATTQSYDSYGRTNAAGVFDNQGITGDIVGRSLAGRVVEQQIATGGAFVDANPAGDNYTYDSAGRLTGAAVPGASYTYGFASSPACTAPSAGLNTNRTSGTVTGLGAGSTTSCYDNADRLVSTNAIPAANITYDDHGNTTRLGDDLLAYDSADRQMRDESPTSIVSYVRDPLDRVAQRTETTRISHVATTSGTAASTSVTLTRPAGTQTGDLVLGSIAAGALLTPGPLTASGWTVATDRSNLLGRTWVVWRYATASDPASWTFSVPGATQVTGALTTYRNAVSSSPIQVTATGASALSMSHPIPQVTTTSDGAQLVHVVGFAGGVTSSAPTGTTQRASVTGASASLLVADRFQSRAGLSTPLSASSSLALTSTSATVALTATTSVSRSGYTGHSTQAQLTTNAAGTITGFAIPLTGRTTFMLSTAGYGYSHSNLHGDTLTVTDLTGNRLWSGVTGPFGEAASSTTPPNTAVPGTRLGWHATDGVVTDRNLTLMGARTYSAANGRFLSVDPIEGGCANNYTYTYGDPVNMSDTQGTGWWDCPIVGKNPNGSCRNPIRGAWNWLTDHQCEVAVGLATAALIIGTYGAGAALAGSALGSAELATYGSALVTAMGVIGNVADAQGLLVACAGGILDDDCVDQAAQIAVGQNLGAVHPFAGGVWNMVSGLLGC